MCERLIGRSDVGLNKQVDYGLSSGKQFSELMADSAWRRINDARDDAQISGGEELDTVSRRIRAGLEALCDRHRRDDLVVVTPAEIIRGALLVAESVVVGLVALSTGTDRIDRGTSVART